MATSPALKRETARTGVFAFASSVLRITTNSPAILSAARSAFAPAEPRAARVFDFKLLVNRRPTIGEQRQRSDLRERPYFRGRDHLVIAVYGGGAMLFDLIGCRAVGVFSEAMARDEEYWRRVVFPVAMGVISATIGVAPLHCATLVRQGRGLHVCGLSGAGKSTLSVALAQRGFALLADDWTYFSHDDAGAVAAHGLRVPIKLMPAAQRFFPELRRLSPTVSLNGELAFEVDPAQVFSAARVYCCAPRRIVFLERRAVARAQWTRLSPEQVENQFRPALERIPDCLCQAREEQHRVIASLAQLESWSLVCSGDPHQIAAEIDNFTASLPADAPGAAGNVSSHFEIPDLMCRFVPAPLVAELAANGVSLRLETDLPDFFALASALRSCRPTSHPQLLCTVLKDNDVPAVAAAAARNGLACQSIPAAVCQIADRRACRIVVFVTEAYASRPAFLRALLEFARQTASAHPCTRKFAIS